MNTKQRFQRYAAWLLALVILFAVGLTAQAAAEGNKTLTVGADTLYRTIQDAIREIDQKQDKKGWTIVVKAGTYPRFTVLKGLHGLTVKAEANAEVIIETLNDSVAPEKPIGGYPDTGGISVREADGVMIEGLTIQVGDQKDPWYVAAVSNRTERSAKGQAMTVNNCDFKGVGSGFGVFIESGTEKWYVTNCTFDSLREGISMYGDGTMMKGANVTGNTFTNCSFALHGYYGGTEGNAGILTFAGNTVTGSDALRCKVVIQDQVNTGAIRVDVKDNTLTDAMVGLVNLREQGETVSDVLRSNELGESSCYVEAVEPGTIDFYTSYRAPGSGAGYWQFNVDEYDEDDPEMIQYVRDAVAKANEDQARELNITGISPDKLIRTFTWFKDALYWKSTSALTVSKEVSGKEGEMDRAWHFTVTLANKDIDGLYGQMRFKNGVSSFTLKHGESATALDLPAGTAYAVTEQEANRDGYVTTSVHGKGTIRENEVITAAFSNQKNPAAIPMTGDGTDLILWAALGCAGLLGIWAISQRGKKER